MELYSYYRLKEKNSESVSGIWKGLHIFLFLSAAIFSIVCTVFFHILIASFDMNCVLYPKEIYLLNNSFYNKFDISSNSNLTYNQIDLPIDFIKSTWSDMNVCYSSLYNPILSVIFGIVWTTFFLMCSKGGKSVSGLTQPWRIVVPSSIFTFIYCIFCLVITHDLTNGFTEFDIEFKNTSGINETIYQSEVNKIETFVFITIISSWMYTICWLIAFILLIIRCLFAADFQLIEVKVELIGADKIDNLEIDQPVVLGSVDPSSSYYTPCTSKDQLQSHSIIFHSNYEHGKQTSDKEDSDAFEDFIPALTDSEFSTPQAESSLIADVSNRDIITPKVNRSVSFVPFSIKDGKSTMK